MSAPPLSRWRQTPGLPAGALLLAVLLTINAVAVAGILSARRSAERAALQDLELQTTAHARALEAVLATLRGDLLFLAQAQPVAHSVDAVASSDLIVRRWGRLDVEGTLLLFLQAHPAVERLVVRTPSGESLVVAGRREGAPVLLPPAEAAGQVLGQVPGQAPGQASDLASDQAPDQPPSGQPPLTGSFPLGSSSGEGGALLAWIDPAALLAMAAPGVEGLHLVRASAVPPPAGGGGLLSVAVPVADEHWAPPVAWSLVRTQSESQLIQSVQVLAGRYRTAVLLNLAVMLLTLALAAVALRQVRRAARLAAENQARARVAELERQMMHSERLASVGRLAAGIAHEINNPLEGMANYLALLEADLEAGEGASALELAGRVREGLERAAAVTRQVLALSDPGRSPRAAFDLGEVLRGTIDFVRGNPAFRPVDLRLETAGEPLPMVGDPTTLGQLFLNLLLNACEAQPEGGEVEVTARRRGDRALVTVADRGPGISPEALAHLFEPFFSTRGSAGLGLAVCHGIATAHAGEIRAANRPEGGARFEVEMPLGEAAA